MKLIVTADDYGISDAVTDGICKCARDGILTQTGLMTNFEGSEYAANRMKEYPHICLGEDINLVAGYPVTNPRLIPSLVQTNGEFKTSKMHILQDENEPNHIPYEEAFLETENQVLKFIKLVGEKPEYLSGHSYGTEATKQAMADVAKKYGITLAHEFYKELGLKSGLETAPWNNTDKPKYFPIEVQTERNPLQIFMNGQLTYLEEALKENKIAHIHTHCGYVDADLLNRSSFTIIRCREAELICSKELKKWVNDNKIQLVSIKELK